MIILYLLIIKSLEYNYWFELNDLFEKFDKIPIFKSDNLIIIGLNRVMFVWKLN